MIPKINDSPSVDKVDILAKYTNHYGDLLQSCLLDEPIASASEAFSAMDEYANEKTKQLQAENKKLLGLLEKHIKNLTPSYGDEAGAWQQFCTENKIGL